VEWVPSCQIAQVHDSLLFSKCKRDRPPWSLGERVPSDVAYTPFYSEKSKEDKGQFKKFTA
jgi:hypothetical protein